MGMVQINNNGPVTNGLAELKNHMQYEYKEIRDGVMGEGQGLSEEDESQINEDLEDINVERREAVQVQVHSQAALQRLQQQPQGPVVCWERFLTLRSLKVLLVENDDSTRHVVSALLKNCGYEVVAVANGLQAWKILENLTNHIDLVLTEVVIPCLSGIGLLCKIMNHNTCKNIPVIMMSCHDSMSIVFKCLSKGAVDFLVKPIRKNELKNLWQHVWRKCHSSSGSGSESGIWTQKSTKSKSAEESDNNTDSNDEDDIGSIGLNVWNGSNNGSGTQSSRTKSAVEVDSPQPMSPWDKLADPLDSTCAQYIHSRLEAFGDSWVPVTATRECKGQDDELDNVVMGKDLEIGVSRIPNLKLELPIEKKVPTNIAGINKDRISGINSKRDDDNLEKGQLELNTEKPNGELRNQAAGLIGVITNSNDPQVESIVFDIPNGLSKVSNLKEKALYDTKEIPSLELSLKRMRDFGDTGTSAHNRNVLRHSDLSAFSRYISASTANQPPTGNVASCSPLDNSSQAVKTESMQNLQSNSSSTPPNQRSNGSSNNNDMCSTTNNFFTKPVAFNDKPVPRSTVKCLHPSPAFQPAQNGHISPPQPVIQGKADAAIANTILAQARGPNQHVQVQHHHHHYHHHHHVHNIPQQRQANHDELPLKNMVVDATRCGSSNVLSAPLIKDNAGNRSLSGSVSGSNHGSSTVSNAGGTNMENGNGVNQNHFAQREAALNKFRQKRKERCFEKKVRYQSRKKLAEQRPRVRGQFVRQVVHENKDTGTHS